MPLPEDATPEKNYLVVRHPVDYVKVNYLLSGSRLGFKNWYKIGAPRPQSSFCPDVHWAIRAEHFENDIRLELSIRAKITLTAVPTYVQVCVATAANIRARYVSDYQLGEYD